MQLASIHYNFHISTIIYYTIFDSYFTNIQKYMKESIVTVKRYFIHICSRIIEEYKCHIQTSVIGEISCTVFSNFQNRNVRFNQTNNRCQHKTEIRISLLATNLFHYCVFRLMNYMHITLQYIPL